MDTATSTISISSTNTNDYMVVDDRNITMPYTTDSTWIRTTNIPGGYGGYFMQNPNISTVTIDPHPMDDVFTVDHYRIVRIAVPGFKAKDIKITFNQKEIKVKLHVDDGDKLISDHELEEAGDIKIPKADWETSFNIENVEQSEARVWLESGILNFKFPLLKDIGKMNIEDLDQRENISVRTN